MMEILLGSEVLKKGIVRVLEPGVFDYQSEKFVIRMRAWGVNFPQEENQVTRMLSISLKNSSYRSILILK